MGGPAWIDGKEHDECDNFLECPFKVDDVTYKTAEHYFQCMKTMNKEDHDYILKAGSGMSAWVKGNEIKLRSDWESQKVKIMYEGNKAKFEQNEDLKKSLCESEGSVKFNNSTAFWNYWNGKIMERIRAEFRGNEGDLEVAETIAKEMAEYEEAKK